MKWSNERILSFYDAFKDYADDESSRDFNKVAEVVGGDITADDCENLWHQHQTFLGLPRAPSLANAFLAMVQDTYKNMALAAEVEGGDNEDDGTTDERAKRTPKKTAKVLSAISPSKSKPPGSRGNVPSPPSSVKRGRAAATYPHAGDETGSAKRKRQRKLFPSDHEGGQGGLDPDAGPPPGSASRLRRMVPRGGSHDDVGEGVDALLHLASVADKANQGTVQEASGRPSASPPIGTMALVGGKVGAGMNQEGGTVEGSLPPPQPLPQSAQVAALGSNRKPPRGPVNPHGSSQATPTPAKGARGEAMRGGGGGGGGGSGRGGGSRSARGTKRPSKYDEDPDEEVEEEVVEGETESDDYIDERPQKGRGRMKPASRKKGSGVSLQGRSGGGRAASRSASLELESGTRPLGLTPLDPPPLEPPLNLLGGGRATKGGGSGRNPNKGRPRASAPRAGTGTGYMDPTGAPPLFTPMEGINHLLPLNPQGGGGGQGGQGGSVDHQGVGVGGIFGYDLTSLGFPFDPLDPLGGGGMIHHPLEGGGPQVEVRVRRKVQGERGGSPGGMDPGRSLLPSIKGSHGGLIHGGMGQGRTPTLIDAANAAAASSALSPSVGLLSMSSPTASHALVQGGLGLRGDPLLGQPCMLQRHAREAALRRCLSTMRLRRWVASEFVYSSIDRPWFLRNELAELLQMLVAAGMVKAPPSAPIPAVPNPSPTSTLTLTRTQWSILHSSLGRPRRLSLSFLKEERVKLEAYREHVRRTHVDHVSQGSVIPPELPRPLRVGQGVVVRHPLNAELIDGTILTASGSSYRVQYSRGDLLSEVMRDIDLMPLDPHESLPLTLPIPPTLLNGRAPHHHLSSATGDGAGRVNQRGVVRKIARGAPSDIGGALGPIVHTTPNPSNAHTLVHTLGMMPTPGGLGLVGGYGQQQRGTDPLMIPLGGMVMSGPMNPRGPSRGAAGGGGGGRGEEDRIVADLSRLLGEKDSLLVRIKAMNDEATEREGGGGGGLTSEGQAQFQRDYSQAILGLKDVNAKVEVSLSLAAKKRTEAASLIALADSIDLNPGDRPLHPQDPLLNLLDYSRTGMEGQGRGVGIDGSSTPAALPPPGSAMAPPLGDLEESAGIREEGRGGGEGYGASASRPLMGQGQGHGANIVYRSIASSFSSALTMVDEQLALMKPSSSEGAGVGGWEPNQAARSMIAGCLGLVNSFEMCALDPSLKGSVSEVIETASRLLLDAEGGGGGEDRASVVLALKKIQEEIAS